MKIGREKVKRLTQRSIAAGVAYYWQPTPAERDKGWKGQPLGHDLSLAIARARKLNDEVEGWKNGGATTRALKSHAKAQTFGAALDRYEAERLPELAATHRRGRRYDIIRLREWAGAHPVTWITRERVRNLRRALMKHATIDGPGHTAAFNLLKSLSAVMSWIIDAYDLSMTNPCVEAKDSPFALAAPLPRNHIWEEADIAAIVAAAHAAGRPGLALAIEVATWTAQREGDLLELSSGKWRESPPLSAEETTTLAGRDGRVMGFEIDQNKGRRARGGIARPLFLYFPAEMQARIEATFAANARRSPATTLLLVDDETGLPWNQTRFIRAFAEIRQAAIDAGNPQIAGLQFRDFRRTCIVRLGRRGLNNAQVAAISGHQLSTINNILRVYMPRDYKMGASAAIAMLPAQEREQAEIDHYLATIVPVDRSIVTRVQSRNSD